MTLDQLSVLMQQYLDTFNDDNIMRALTLSRFLVYLRKQQPTNVIKGEFNGQTNWSRSESNRAIPDIKR